MWHQGQLIGSLSVVGLGASQKYGMSFGCGAAQADEHQEPKSH